VELNTNIVAESQDLTIHHGAVVTAEQSHIRSLQCSEAKTPHRREQTNKQTNTLTKKQRNTEFQTTKQTNKETQNFRNKQRNKKQTTATTAARKKSHNNILTYSHAVRNLCLWRKANENFSRGTCTRAPLQT